MGRTCAALVSTHTVVQQIVIVSIFIYVYRYILVPSNCSCLLHRLLVKSSFPHRAQLFLWLIGEKDLVHGEVAMRLHSINIHLKLSCKVMALL